MKQNLQFILVQNQNVKILIEQQQRKRAGKGRERKKKILWLENIHILHYITAPSTQILFLQRQLHLITAQKSQQIYTKQTKCTFLGILIVDVRNTRKGNVFSHVCMSVFLMHQARQEGAAAPSGQNDQVWRRQPQEGLERKEPHPLPSKGWEEDTHPPGLAWNLDRWHRGAGGGGWWWSVLSDNVNGRLSCFNLIVLFTVQ